MINSVYQLKPSIMDTYPNFLTIYGEYLTAFGFAYDQRASSALLKTLLTEDWLGGFCTILETMVTGFCIFSKTYSQGACARAYVIEDLYVSSVCRGKGIGSLLMDATSKYAKDSGARHIFVNADRDDMQSMKFYEKNGFIDVHVNLLRKHIG